MCLYNLNILRIPTKQLGLKPAGGCSGEAAYIKSQMTIFPKEKNTQKDDSLHSCTKGVIIEIWNSLMHFGDKF